MTAVPAMFTAIATGNGNKMPLAAQSRPLYKKMLRLFTANSIHNTAAAKIGCWGV